MKKYAIPVAFLGAIGLAVWIANAQGVSPPKKAGWHYAIYVEAAVGDKVTYIFTGGAQHAGGESTAEFYRKLVGQDFVKRFPDDECSRMDILDALGAAGWEMVSTRDFPMPAPDSKAIEFYFKRATY